MMIDELNSLVHVESLSHHYSGDNVLEDINFNVEKGMFLTVLGLNGAGKSTLMNILSGHMLPSKGQIFLFGKNQFVDRYEIKRDVALVSEKFNIESRLNLKNFAQEYSQFFSNWDQQIFDEIFSYTQLNPSFYFSDLSRGQKMQYALTLALAKRPRLLFVDEVTSVLDYRIREFFMSRLKNVLEDGAVVFATNIINEVHQQTTDFLILKNASVKIMGKKEIFMNTFCKLVIPQNISINETNLYSLGFDSRGHRQFIAKRDGLSPDQLAYLKEGELNLSEIFVHLTEN